MTGPTGPTGDTGATGGSIILESLSRSGWTASASDQFSGSYDASKAIDGNPATFWNSSIAAFPHWWSVDLGSVQDFAAITLLPRQDGMGQNAGTVELYVSDNGSDWGAAVETTTFHSINTALITWVFSQPYTHRYAMLRFLNNSEALGNYIAVAEINLMIVSIAESAFVDYASPGATGATGPTGATGATGPVYGMSATAAGDSGQLDSAYSFFLASGGTAGIALTLPNVSSVTVPLVVMKVDPTNVSAPVSVLPESPAQLNGATGSCDLANQWQYGTFATDGTDWFIIGKN
jgi:hypothetical protein